MRRQPCKDLGRNSIQERIASAKVMRGGKKDMGRSLLGERKIVEEIRLEERGKG